MLLSLSTSAAADLRDYQSHSMEHQWSLASVDGLARNITKRLKQNGKPLLDKESPLPQTHRSVLFLSDNQSEPQYEPILEFGDADTKRTSVTQSPVIPIPWYVISSGKSRLSGWKDGNTLYTAKITYHS